MLASRGRAGLANKGTQNDADHPLTREAAAGRSLLRVRAESSHDEPVFFEGTASVSSWPYRCCSIFKMALV